jgi:hypothetical protein
MPMQNEPDPLRTLCTWVMPELEDEVLPGQDLLDFAISCVPVSEREKIARQIEQILSKHPSDQELKDLWLNSGARLLFEEPEFYPHLYLELKNRLQGKPATFQI